MDAVGFDALRNAIVASGKYDIMFQLETQASPADSGSFHVLIDVRSLLPLSCVSVCCSTAKRSCWCAHNADLKKLLAAREGRQRSRSAAGREVGFSAEIGGCASHHHSGEDFLRSPHASGQRVQCVRSLFWHDGVSEHQRGKWVLAIIRVSHQGG